MKHVRIKLEDDLHRRVKVVAVSTGATLQQALSEGARLYAESKERDLRELADTMAYHDERYLNMRTPCDDAPDPANSPRSLRELAQLALDAEKDYWLNDVHDKAEPARLALMRALDAQEATLRRCRELVEGWENPPRPHDTGINNYDRGWEDGQTEAAAQLRQALDGTAPAQGEEGSDGN